MKVKIFDKVLQLDILSSKLEVEYRAKVDSSLSENNMTVVITNYPSCKPIIPKITNQIMIFKLSLPINHLAY